MFGTERKRKWIKRGKKLGSTRKNTDKNPGAAVSVYQIQLDKPGLVPQFSGKLTSTRIWVDQVMVNHFGDLTYVHLMRSTSQEENLVGKSSFERWSDTFGVKINRNYADNGRLFWTAFYIRN